MKVALGEKTVGSVRLVIRWVLLVSALLVLRELAGVGPYQVGDIPDPLVSSHFRSVVVSGIGLCAYTLLAVVGRDRRPASWLMALGETLTVGAVALWPTIDIRAAEFLGDRYSEVFYYRVFFGIWLAGAMLGLGASTRAYLHRAPRS